MTKAVALLAVLLAAPPLGAQRAPSGTIVASNMDAHSASIVDVASGRTIATIQTGEGPHEVAISPNGRRAVVAIYGNRNAVGSSLMVIDLNAPTAPPKIVELGAGNQRPHGLAFLADNASLLVTGERAQRVLVVNVDNGMIDSSMSTMQPATHMVSASRDYSRAFTTNITGMSVSAIDVAPMSPSDGVAPVPLSPQGVAMSRDNATAYVTLKAVAKVAVVDLQRGVIVKYLPVGAGSDGVGYSPIVVK